MTKEDLERVRKASISTIEKSDGFILCAGGTVAVVGNQINATANIVTLTKYLLEKLPRKMNEIILACLISELKNEGRISDKNEKLAQKILDEIKKLK